MISEITDSIVKAGMSYEQYRALIDQLLMGDKTTGDNQSPEMIGYTRLNVQRMNKLDKKIQLEKELENKLIEVPEKWYWLVITEAWSGDAAQNIPIIEKMAAVSENIELKLLLRDENPALMDQYLTHGGRSIPMLICIRQEDFAELGVWGPRPEPAQKLVTDFKANPFGTQEEFVQSLHNWYAKDRGKTIQEEFMHLLEIWFLSEVRHITDER